MISTTAMTKKSLRKKQKNISMAKYTISLNHDFEDLDALARYFATVMVEVEKNRDKNWPETGHLKMDPGDVISGTDWDVEQNLND